MLSHVDANNQPTMVDVTDKAVTERMAQARTHVRLPESVRALIVDGDIQGKKGPVFQTAIIAGTMAAKKTSELIPFCHPLPLSSVKFHIGIADDGRVLIDCTVKVTHNTGVEMEALTGASLAALTIYDMVKAVSHDIVIEDTRLLAKSGGKHDVDLR
ncbi:MAG: cyclic pyranopterin phosphate synthase [Rhodothermales bacterium]|jgi:cyclic pyranopterin phosphate synthase